MSVKLKESQAQDLLVHLRGHDVEQKISEFAAMKAQIKHQALEPDAFNPLFEACRIGVASSNNSLSTHALSCLSHLIKRATLQDPSRNRPHVQQVLPLLIEKLGDQRDRNRVLAMNSLLELWKSCPTEVERGIKETGFGSRNQKVRQESVNWLGQIHKNQQGFSFRSFTPFLMKLLEDSAEPVRDTTKDVVVELFRNAPDHAKSDLKRELQKRQVRKGIAAYILAQLGLGGGAEVDLRSTAKTPVAEVEDDAPSNRHGKSVAGGSINGSLASSTYVASLPGSEMEEMEPLYVNTNRELEDIFRDMPECFEGRESEHNWAARDRSMTKLRQLARGNAYRDFQATFQAGIKSMTDNIIKQTTTLRTTPATNGLQLVKDLAIVMGPGLDAQSELLLMSLIKLCAGTKKITSQQANTVTAILLTNMSFHHKVIAHMYDACTDKNIQPRSYAAGWIEAILDAHIDQKAYMEHNGCVDVLDKCVKRGLADASPAVRESMRKLYWKYMKIWPQRAEAIMEGLEDAHKKLLEKANPSGVKAGAAGLRGPMARSVTAGTTRPSIKEAILAQKRGRVNVKTAPKDLGHSIKEASTPAPAGLAMAPVRRPKMQKTQTAPAAEKPDKHPINPISLGEREPYTRGSSPAITVNSRSPRGNGYRSPEPPSPQAHRFARGVTPGRGRAQSPLVGSRKLTVLEQLNHSDWKIRVEGVVIVACILAKRTPPNYDGQKMPTLPPSDVFAPTLAKLLNDPQPEVVEHVVAPEVLAELAKVVPMEQIVPKVLLLGEGDDEEHAQPINASSLPALKQLMTEPEAAELLFKVITSMSTTGVVPRKLALGSFTTTQKRKISNGCMAWLNEIVEANVNGAPNEFLSDIGNYKALVNRLIAMVNNTKPPNSISLAALLKNLERLDPESFNKILMTFESSTVKELRRAWGVNVEDDTDQVVVEEKVADVEQVLGSVPQVGGRTPGKLAIPSPEPVSPTPTCDNSLSKDEDVTLITPAGIPSLQRPATPSRQERPQTPPGPASDIPDLLSSPGALRRGGSRDDAKPIEVYQDPVVESNGAVATTDKALTIAPSDWSRAKMKKQISSANLPKTPEHSTRLLTTLTQRLQTREMDTQAFRKLMGVARENPVRAVLQDSNGEDLHDIWEGGHLFEELLESLLEYLSCEDIPKDRAADLRVQALLVLKQLLSKATPYFSRHEPVVLTTLVTLRGKYPTQSHVTTGIEEISEEFLQVADPKTGIDALLNLALTPAGEPTFRAQPQSWCMTLTCLAALVRASKVSSLEPQFLRLGELAVKSLDDEDAEVRRACVAMCIEMHSKLNDDERLFDEILKGMKSGHQNLLTYYFAKREGETTMMTTTTTTTIPTAAAATVARQ